MTKHHFYGSNFAEWKTAENIHDVVEWFEKQDCNYNLYFVPLENSAEYKIISYMPDVEGATFLGTFRGRKLV